MIVNITDRKDIELDEEDEEETFLPRSEWKHAQIELRSMDDLEDCFQEERMLWVKGITFDTGTGFGCRDWELDWSVSVE